MSKTKPHHYIIVLIMTLGFLGFMRWRAIQQDFTLVDGSANTYIQSDERHFKNLRQLTFSGENAEAYFSSDSKKLIFQAHDGEGLCDQIYIMDLFHHGANIISHWTFSTLLPLQEI